MSKLMRYVLGIVLPPVGVFLTYGVGVQLLVSVGLTLLGWLPGSIHAVWAISKFNDDAGQTGTV
ncbi:MAG: YqaE/Pmp3 family membrane protein [Synechococcales cyanobacterium RM1_1_8]|nr:YqaE/Pmp3 family membrane protein [Synechococcales cyanobacterium RM1_1_8]